MSDQNPVQSSKVKPRKVEWLWRERIPKGTISVVAGKPDQGKGLFTAHLAADVSQRGGKVLYSAIEDAPEMMTRPRLEAAGAKLDNILLWRFVLPAQQRELEDIIVDNEIDLLVIDPFAAHLHGVGRFSDDIRQVTNPMSALIEQTGTSVVIVEHALKRMPAHSHPLNAIGGGGSGLVAATRMAFLIGTDPSDRDTRVLCCVKSNLRERPKALAFDVDTQTLPVVGEIPYLDLTGEVDFDASRLVTHSGKGTPGRKPDKRAAVCEWLTTYLADAGKPVKAGDVQEDAKQHNFSGKTVRRAADDMEVVKQPPGGGRNCTWELNDEVKAALGMAVAKPKPKKARAAKAKPRMPRPSKPVKASDVDIDKEFAELLKGKNGGES